MEFGLEIGRSINIVMTRCLTTAGDVWYPVGVGIFSMWIVAGRRKLAAGTRAELGSCGHLDRHGLRRMSPGRAVYDPFPERQVEGNPAGV
ncbi:MAG: hypothetical protein ACLU38_12300 [Dysosmobacter sp.]